MDSRLDIDGIACLESLRVCLVHIPRFSRHPTSQYLDGSSKTSFGDDIPAGLARIIRQNPRMKALHLCLQNSKITLTHDSHPEVRQHALAEIGRTAPHLDTLSLEGDFIFDEAAWSTWSSNFRWDQLRSLSIANMSIMQPIIGRLKGRLPMLRMLRLSAYEEYHCSIHNDFHKGAQYLKTFLAGLSLTHLSMLGFHPDILFSGIESGGSTLQNLRFHIRENATALSFRGPTFPTLLLSAAQIAVLKSRCMNLRWIGIDIPRSGLEGANGDLDPSVTQAPATTGPVGGRTYPSAAACAQRSPHRMGLPFSAAELSRVLSSSSFRDPAFLSSRSNPVLSSSFWHRPLLSEQNIPTNSGAFLDSLATMPSLRHIRLFVHTDHNIPWTLSNADAIATFERLRSRKQGWALQSLLICGGKECDKGLWIIDEMGPHMATLKYWDYRKSFRELWNTKDGIAQEHEPLHWKDWNMPSEFGIPDGW